ncbi:hypothetical protein ACRCUN_24270 [Mycobacterium sp. LTG2003]
MRIFVADAGNWTELTDGHEPTVRISAPDLAQARRLRSRLRSEEADTAVVLDVTVAVAGDYRSARRGLELAGSDATVRYVGTVDGLAGLIDDIGSAGVADGVTLLPATPGADLRALGADVLRRLQVRSQARAS